MIRSFLKRKNIEVSLSRYGIDAVSAMAQGLFCTLLVGTILNTLGDQFHIGFLTAHVAGGMTVGGLASAMSGPAMAVAIGYALQAPVMVLLSLAPVGYATNLLGGAGGPLAVLIVAILAAECGKAVSKETRIDILVTPISTILIGVGLACLIARPVGAAASWTGDLVMWATDLHPLLMGIIVSAVMGIALTLPISSAAICAALGLTGLAGGAALAGCCAQMVGFAVLGFRENRFGGLVSVGIGTSMLQMNGAAINSGMGTCGLCGPIGVWTGWMAPSDAALASGAVAMVPGVADWVGLALVCVILPALLCWAMGAVLRRIGWIRDGDLLIG